MTTNDLTGRLRAEAGTLDAYCGRDDIDALLGEAADHIDKLERWKREATEVLAGWDRVSSMLPGRAANLGRSKSDVVADRIEQLEAGSTRRPWRCSHE